MPVKAHDDALEATAIERTATPAEHCRVVGGRTRGQKRWGNSKVSSNACRQSAHKGVRRRRRRREGGPTLVDLLLGRVEREVADVERRRLGEKRSLAMAVKLQAWSAGQDSGRGGREAGKHEVEEGRTDDCESR
jgi:hypothetical protein